jgi:hypothetical protein
MEQDVMLARADHDLYPAKHIDLDRSYSLREAFKLQDVSYAFRTSRSSFWSITNFLIISIRTESKTGF